MNDLFEIWRNMNIFCSENLFWFQSYWSRDILQTFRLLFANYTVVIQTLYTNVTLLCHIIIWLVSNYCVRVVTLVTCEAENIHSFRNTWFHSLQGVHDFTHSLYLLYRICQSMDFVFGLMTLVCLPELVWLLCQYLTHFIILNTESLHGNQY